MTPVTAVVTIALVFWTLGVILSPDTLTVLLVSVFMLTMGIVAVGVLVHIRPVVIERHVNAIVQPSPSPHVRLIPDLPRGRPGRSYHLT